MYHGLKQPQPLRACRHTSNHMSGKVEQIIIQMIFPSVKYAQSSKQNRSGVFFFYSRLFRSKVETKGAFTLTFYTSLFCISMNFQEAYKQCNGTFKYYVKLKR